MVEGYEKQCELQEYHAAIIASTIANVNRPKNSKPFKIKDFMPCKNKEQKEQTPDEQLAIVKQLNTLFGGEVVNK